VITADLLLNGGNTQDQALKGAKPGKGRKRARKDRDPATAAHEMARGAMDAAGEDCEPETGKSYQDRGITEGPGVPLVPHRPAPAQAFGRGYLHEGHAAPSPGQEAPAAMPAIAPGAAGAGQLRHVDLTGDRGYAIPLGHLLGGGR